MSRLLKALQMFPRALAKCGLPPPPVTIQRRAIALSFWTKVKGTSGAVLDHPSSREFTDLKFSSAERELVHLLCTEILEEQLEKRPFEWVHGFEAVFCGSQITLIKEGVADPVHIIFNVSKRDLEHDKDEITEKLSSPFRIMPKFEVQLRRGNTLLSIFCEFLSEAFKDGVPLLQEDKKTIVDVFEIEEMSLVEQENTYNVKADIIEDNLYCAFIDFLTEQGITNEFAVKLSDLATVHEHEQYIGFLERLSKFVVPPPPMESHTTDDSSR